MKTNIHEIYTETIKSLSSDVHGRIKYANDVIVWLKLFPLFISIFLLFLQVYLNDIIIDYLISFISIFAGLFFALIFVVADKYNNRRNSKRFIESGKIDEENVLYIKRYQKFSKQFVTQISYMILISIVLVILFVITSQLLSAENVEYQEYLKHLLKGTNDEVVIRISVIRFLKVIMYLCIYYLFIQYIIILLLLVCNLYRIIIEDIRIS